MVSPDGRWVMVYNGEIVNFADVRRNYRGPWNFRTSGDTEVMLASFAVRGLEALHEWVGMFAFALLDIVENKLYLVRDRFGIKPLYWAQTPDGGFVFGSENSPHPAIREVGCSKPECYPHLSGDRHLRLWTVDVL